MGMFHVRYILDSFTEYLTLSQRMALASLESPANGFCNRLSRRQNGFQWWCHLHGFLFLLTAQPI